MQEAMVVINRHLRRTVDGAAPLVFGRHQSTGVVPLSAPDDTRISKRQGELSWEGRALVLTNLSASVWMRVEYRDTVLHHQVPPGSRHVFSTDALVLIEGRASTKTVAVAVPSSARLAAPITDTAHGPQDLTDEQRRALVALFAGYLRRHPHHVPRPLTARQAAHLIGVSQSAVERRIERVKDDIVAATGEVGFAPRVHELAEHLFVTGTLSPADITEIGEPFAWEGPA